MIKLYKLLKCSTSNLKVFQSKHNFSPTLSPLYLKISSETTLVSTILEMTLFIVVDWSAMYHKGT